MLAVSERKKQVLYQKIHSTLDSMLMEQPIRGCLDTRENQFF